MNKIIGLSLFLFISLGVFSQKEVKTYYDPFQQTKIKERYYVNGKNQKHGKYIKYDDRGLKAVEINFTNGQPNGIAKEYALPLVGYPGDEKVKKEANYVNGNQHGKTSYYVYIKDGKENIKEGKKILQGEEFYENGKKIREIAYFIDGKKEVDAYLENGVQKKWYDNGQLANEIHVENGSFNGPWKQWYTNGQIGVDGIKKAGKFFGEKKEYYVDGTLKHIENYAQGDINGIIFEGNQKYYDSTGVLTHEYIYSPLENGTQTKQVIEYFPNGNKKLEYTEVVSNRKAGNSKTDMTGAYIAYHPNGKKSIEGNYNKGTRVNIWRQYDIQESIVLELEFKEGRATGGKWIMFYDINDREVFSTENAHYFKEFIFLDNGKLKDDLLTEYYINGEKKFTSYLKQFPKNILDGETSYYYENGSLMAKGMMKNNNKIGTWKDYYENGNIKIEYEFIFDDYGNKSEKHGHWIYFNENGKLEKIEVYRQGTLKETKTGEQAIAEQINILKNTLVQNISIQNEKVKTLYIKRIMVGEDYIEKTQKKKLYNA